MTKTQIRVYAKLLYAMEYMGRYCSICGIDGFDNPFIMDFHHINPSTKLLNIKNQIGVRKFDNIKHELDKCMLLCAHCHRTTHSKIEKYNSYKTDIISKMESIRNLNGKTTSNISLSDTDKLSILAGIDEGKTIKEICLLINKSYDTVKGFIRTTNKKAVRSKKSNLLPKSIILQMYNTNKNSVRYIAKHFKVSPNVITDTLLANNIKIRENFRIDLEKVKELISINYTNFEISKIIGCSSGSIWRIRQKNNI